MRRGWGMACGGLRRRGCGQHFGGDLERDADNFILVVDGGVVDQRFEECILFVGHLVAGARIGERHGAGHFSGFEQEGELHGVFQGVTFGVERDFQIVAVRLAGERDGLDAAGDLFELR